mmetsp:Transcript_36723/g.103631  ORF Transcript_36723/g.103631 Transcript_36723/m.103631 type:complete len:200 (-) Transcript_36723:167-766(-)
MPCNEVSYSMCVLPAAPQISHMLLSFFPRAASRIPSKAGKLLAGVMCKIPVGHWVRVASCSLWVLQHLYGPSGAAPPQTHAPLHCWKNLQAPWRSDASVAALQDPRAAGICAWSERYGWCPPRQAPPLPRRFADSLRWQSGGPRSRTAEAQALRVSRWPRARCRSWRQPSPPAGRPRCKLVPCHAGKAPPSTLGAAPQA